MPPLLPRRLSARRPGRINPSLEATAAALGALGHPERAFPSVLVAGTNGKGSTAAILEAILAAHGLEVGLYTSPHLLRAGERIRIGGRDATDAELDRWLAPLDAHPELSYFEALTVAALLAFAERRVDVAVLEVGMGGRWDATRLAGPVVAGLTNVGTDHARFLGATREAVAAEKGAALAGTAVAVLGPEVEPRLLPHLGRPDAVPAAELVPATPSGERLVATLAGSRLELPPPLPGRHQLANLHLALALSVACHRAGIAPAPEPRRVHAGLGRVRWTGRLSRHRIAGRPVLLDGAHNAEAAAALAAHLVRLPEEPVLIFSCLEDKPVEAMAAALSPAVREVVAVPLEDERAMPVERIAAAFPGCRVAPEPLEAVRRAEGPVVAAGSLRLVAALLRYAEPEEAG